MKKLGIFIVSGIALFLFFANTSQAFSPVLIINEVMPDPDGEDSKLEWIELKNVSSDNVRLDQWKINDKYLPQAIIKPNQIFILARDKIAFLNANHTDALVVQASFSLPNTGGKLTIMNKDNNTADSFDYQKAETGHSFELLSGSCSKTRINSTGSTLGKENLSCLILSITPSAVPSSAESTKNISCFPAYIKRAVPNPSSGAETITIANPNSKDIYLTNWKINNNANKSETIKDMTVKSNSEITINLNKINLDNDGDILKLICGETIADIFAYPKAEKGIVYGIIKLDDQEVNFSKKNKPVYSTPKLYKLK